MRRLRVQGWRWRLLILSIGGGLLAGLSLADWDFALILKNAESRYGNLGPARERILDWEALIKSSAALSEAAQNAGVAISKIGIVTAKTELQFGDDDTISVEALKNLSEGCLPALMAG